MKLTTTFHCEYCDEELGTEMRNGDLFHDEFHDCIGEKFGLVAQVSGGRINTASGVYANVEN